MNKRSLRYRFLPLMALIVIVMSVTLLIYHGRVSTYLTQQAIANNKRLSRIYTREVDAAAGLHRLLAGDALCGKRSGGCLYGGG